MKLAIGQYDAPRKQTQPIFEIDPYKSHIAVFGAPLSGKTTFIKTLLVRLHEKLDQLPEENIYIIDFGGNIGQYSQLRNVCACCDSSNEENIKRIFRTVEKRLDENTAQLESKNYGTVAEEEPEKAPAHMLLIIENVNALFAEERFTTYQERLLHFCRDGLSKGLTVVITASELHGLNRLLTSFSQKVAFEMPADAYYDIFNTKVKKPIRIPGRGIINIESEPYEFQCFLPFPCKDDRQYIETLVAETSHIPNKNKMRFFPSELTKENFGEYCMDEKWRCSDSQVAVGLDYYEHKPICVNFDQCRSIAIMGKRNFGKTNLLSLLLEGVKKYRPEARYVLFDDGREALKPFCADGEKAASEDVVYLTKLNELTDYLSQNGYGAKPRGSTKEVEILDTPFTVFVIQAKIIFRHDDNKYLIARLFPSMISEAVDRNYLFIFSDVPSISNLEIRDAVNYNISTAFLLDNIGDYLARQNNRTVFGELDAREMRMEYAGCVCGDGFVYDVESDKLQKLKFIKDC